MGAAFGDDVSDGDGTGWRPGAAFAPEQVRVLRMSRNNVALTFEHVQAPMPLADCSCALSQDISQNIGVIGLVSHASGSCSPCMPPAGGHQRTAAQCPVLTQSVP